MRDRIWNNLANINFKAIYTGKCSRLAAVLGNIYSFTLAFASASSVAAWAIWKQYPNLWAIIVGISQVLIIAKPYLPFLKSDKEYLEMSFEFDALYLEYERLWYDFEKGNIVEHTAEEMFYRLRQKEMDIEKSHKTAPCPELSFLMRRTSRETDAALSRNFT